MHRPTADACPLSPRELGGAGGQSGATSGSTSGAGCESDADCTAHPDGYCLAVFQGNPECFYSCRTDADCATDEVCACDTTQQRPSSSAPLTLGNCVPAACHTDADCSEQSLCVAPLEGVCAQDPVGRPAEFHCQTPADECSGRGDCAAAAGAADDSLIFNEFSCRYDEGAGHSLCGSPVGC